MLPTRLSRSRLRDGRTAVLLLAGLLLSAVSACRAPAKTSSTTEVYSVRGELVRLPAAGSSEVWIHHEAVPKLRDDRGRVTGMESMTMPFDLASDADLSGLRVGDPVRFELPGGLAGRSFAGRRRCLPEAPAGHPARFRPAASDGDDDSQITRRPRQRGDRLSVVDAALQREPQSLGERQALHGERFVVLQILPAGLETAQQEEVDPFVGEARGRPDAAQRNDLARGEAGLFLALPSRRPGRFLAGLELAGRHLEQPVASRRVAVLTHQQRPTFLVDRNHGRGAGMIDQLEARAPTARQLDLLDPQPDHLSLEQRFAIQHPRAGFVRAHLPILALRRG